MELTAERGLGYIPKEQHQKDLVDIGVMGMGISIDSTDPTKHDSFRGLPGAWHRTLRALLKRAAREGSVHPELDTDDVAALLMATLTSMTLPTVASGPRIDQALRQLERWLGVNRSRPSN